MADKRAERMGEFLRAALLELLDEKAFEQVTVRELVERAGVSKNSFYAHYGSLASLAQDCYLHEGVYFGPLHRRRADYPNRYEAAWDLMEQRAHQLEFLRDHFNLARVILLNVGTSPYFRECEEAEETLTLDHLLFEYGPEQAGSPMSYQRCAQFIFAGTYGLYRSWFSEGMKESVESVVRSTVYLGLHDAAGAVGRPIEAEYLAAINAWKH